MAVLLEVKPASSVLKLSGEEPLHSGYQVPANKERVV